MAAERRASASPGRVDARTGAAARTTVRESGLTAHASEGPALYVDLDGTLVSTDLLWESLWSLLRSRPSDALRLPFWLVGGKAYLKERIAQRAPVQPDGLPYRPETLAYVKEARRRGRCTVLATASNRRLAAPIAAHLGIFDAVLASDDKINLSGEAKLRAIREHCGGADFHYAGDSRADLPIWQGARRAVLVAPSAAAARGASALSTPVESLPVERPWRVRAALRAIRPHQWIKNSLLFVPLFLAHQASDPARLMPTLIAFFTFCLCASATYILNDLLDLEADRKHPRKRERPLASGALSIPHGVAMTGIGLAVGFGLSIWLLSWASTAMLTVYVVLTCAYSFKLKEILLVDVLVLAGLYAHRVLAGAVAAAVPVSPWLIAFSIFLFLSLALVKRYVELLSSSVAGVDDDVQLARRGYRGDDVGLVETMGVGSGFMAVLVIGLYVSSDAVSRLYPRPELLWAISLVLLYWITRMWFLARRGHLPDDPVLFAATDRVSYAAGAIILVIGALAALPGFGGGAG